MKKLLKGLLSASLLFALIISCGGTETFIDQAKKGISSKNFDAALAAIDSALVENPNNGYAYFLRGQVYAELASNNPIITDRKDQYQNMRDALKTAESLYGTDPAGLARSLEGENLIKAQWSIEHNTGVKYATGDTTLTNYVDDPLEYSVNHLINATIINPDSTLSFEVLAEVYRVKGDFEGAVSSLKKARALRTSPEYTDYSNLGTYYLNANNYTDAVTILKEGIDLYPDSLELVQKIADAYLNLGERENALSTLEELIKRDPNNAQYHLVLGTQVYLIASAINDEVSVNYDTIFELERAIRNLRGAEKSAAEKRLATLKADNTTKLARADELTQDAVASLLRVIELRPNDPVAYNTLGIVYQNKAASLFEQRNATTNNELAAELDTQAKDELRIAMGYYEKATEITPDNTDYWKSLFNVYTTLGMNDKAADAMNKAGM